MPSGYGAYANGNRKSGFGLGNTPTARMSGIFDDTASNNYQLRRSANWNSEPTSSATNTACDTHTKLMSQMIEQWMPSFTEFSRMMSDTSSELAKSRLQNEELSRLLRETRNQLDLAISDQQKRNQHTSPPKPPSIPILPTNSVPSFEDWRALNESLREVASTLRDFRQWLPATVGNPMYFPPPPPPTLLPPSELFTLENQQKAHLALSQLAALQQQAQMTQPGSCLLLSKPPPPPAVQPLQGVPDFRLPPPTTSLFHPGSSLTEIPLGSASKSCEPAVSETTAEQHPMMKSPATVTPSRLNLNTTTPQKSKDTPTVQEVISPNVSLPAPFLFKPNTTSAGTSSIFSFSKFDSPSNINGCSKASSIFGNLSFNLKSNNEVAPPRPQTPVKETPKSVDLDADNDEKPEAFEPTVEFAPCVKKLPDLVKQTTGEEHESPLFCQRARLFRFDKPENASVGEWKTRGTGELKILSDDKSIKFRIVMRRDQTMKLCANHYILPGINFKRHEQKAVACIWNALDFAVLDADNPNPNGTDEVFMVQFKSENVTDEFEKVVKACLEKASSAAVSKIVMEEETKSEKQIHSDSTALDRLKPKIGSWTCSVCALVVGPSSDKCPACNTPKQVTTAQPKSSLDNLKPKPGSWECATCALVVAPDVDLCPACQTSKPGIKTLPTTTSRPLFNFLSSSPLTTKPVPALKTSFVFGSPSNNTTSTAPTFAFGPAFTSNTTVSSKVTTTSSVFGFSPSGLPADKSKSYFGNPSAVATEPLKPIENVKPGFTFNLKPPTPMKKEADGDNEEDENDEVAPADLSQVNFTPVVDNLPENVEVRTGEEGEEIKFEARAKLFRFENDVWKERGLGQLKLLQEPTSGRVRLVMRREQVHKVCCNHIISANMSLAHLEGSKAAVKPWVWWAFDFSDCETTGPEGKKEMFSVRFKTQEESKSFYDTFMSAAKSCARSYDEDDVNDDELVILEESTLSPDQLARARALRLPDDFYAYESKTTTGRRHFHQEDMTEAEEAEEDALLERAVNRCQPSVTSSADENHQTSGSGTNSVIDLSSSIAVAERSCGGTSDSRIFPSQSGENTPINRESHSCEQCSSIGGSRRGGACPGCHKSQPLADKTAEGNLSNGTAPFAGKFLGFGGLNFGAVASNTGFDTLSQQTDSKPTWLTPDSSSNHTWTGAGSTIFGNLEASADEPTENDPDPQFEPIIPLPNLVVSKTGEEDLVCLFLRRCKLYRMVDNQWKERGIGDMKILVKPKNPQPDEFLNSRVEFPTDKDLNGGISYARLLMRRDQVLKICVNHTISADLPQFKPLTVANNAVCWVANDFSEDPSGEVMTLGVKFKTEQDLACFHASVKRAQSLLER